MADPVLDETIPDARLAAAEATYEELREKAMALRAYRSPNIHQRIHAVMLDLRKVDKSRENKHQHYKYIGHDDVTEPLAKAFLDHGIVQIVSTTIHDRQPLAYKIKKANYPEQLVETSVLKICVEIRWVNIDSPSDVVSVRSFGETELQAGRNCDVSVGMAMAYAVKMAQLKTFMLTGGVPDSDVDSGQGEQRPAATAPASPRPPVEEGEVAALITEYGEIADSVALASTRKKVDPIASRLSKEQYDRVLEADVAARKRVAGKS